MRFCCQNTEQKGKYALQMHQTPSELSQISQQKDVILKGLIPKQKSQVLNRMAKNSQKGEIKIANILNYLMISNIQQQTYSLKKVLKSNYEQLLDKFYNTNNKWTDPDFPPEQKSFGLGRQTQKVVWKRIDQIIKKPVFISGSIASSDILQGKIGDCYFLSAIAGLAENDKRISKIFSDLNINKNGIYMARILHRGVYQEVVVDDYFPVSKRDNKLMGSRPSNGQQIWVMILQKCWAKLYGSYQAIDGGLPNEVLHAFSAAPIFQYLTNVEQAEQQNLFQLMIQASARGWVMCCGTYPRPDMDKIGLVQGHAYTVLHVFDRPRPLIKIRNPWGQMEWRGGASDKDNFWKTVSANDKKLLGYGAGDDGIFFMFWQDFLEHFQLVNICKVQQNSNYYYDQLTYPRGQPVYSALQTNGGAATIGLTQANTRSLPVQQPRYASSTIIVGRKINNVKGDNYQYIKTLTAHNQCDVNLELDLVSGEYVVYSTLIGRNQQQEGTISCYGETPVQLSPITQINSQEFLHSIFLDHARKNTENQQQIFGRMDVWVCMQIVYQCGYGYTVVHIGPSVKTKLGLTFNEQQYIENSFELLPPFKDAGTFKITCQSGQDSIVLCRIIRKNYAIEASLPIPNIKRLC